MEKEINQQELLAKNLIYYRKASGLTQLELAEKFNYSDKSISKWERGEGFPDIFVLKSLADFYGISVDDFYLEEHKQVIVSHSKRRKQIYMRLLSVGIGWIVIVLSFFLLNTLLPPEATFKSWLVFIYGVVISSIILLVWEFIYHERFYRMIATSVLIWSIAASIYFTLLVSSNYTLNLYLIFVVPVPLQILEVLWFLYRSKKNKTGN